MIEGKKTLQNISQGFKKDHKLGVLKLQFTFSFLFWAQAFRNILYCIIQLV